MPKPNWQQCCCIENHDLEAALEQFRLIAGDLNPNPDQLL
jgi:hypothetical protein